MSPHVRNTIILVLVFAALLAGWWLLETYQPGAKPAETPGAGKYLFATLAVDDVEGMEVKLRSGKSVYVFKGPSAWHLGGMGGERLDDNGVRDGIGGIIELQAQRTFTAGLSLTEVGLDAPTATIKLTLVNKRTEVLLVGDTNPEGLAFYVQQTGDPAIHLVSRYAIDRVLGWVSAPPLEPTPTPSAFVTVVVTATPQPSATPVVTPTVTITPPLEPTPTPSAFVTVVVTATPQPSATPVVTPTVTITPTATTRP